MPPDEIKLPIITAEDELLVWLRVAPARRGVGYVKSLGDDEEHPAVMVYPEGVLFKGKFVAWIAEAGSASELLERAYHADLDGDAAAWSSLPLRYGPFCSTWVLPDHPQALKAPGSQGDP